MLDLPPAFRDAWCLSADNGLVLGASVLGAQVLAATHSVGYRIHDSNGRWSNRSARAEYINRMHSGTLIRHYAQQAGIGPECVELSKPEFLTRPNPPWAEVKRYDW